MSEINYIRIMGSCTLHNEGFFSLSHIYKHELVCIYDRFTQQNRVSMLKIEKENENMKQNLATKGKCVMNRKWPPCFWKLDLQLKYTQMKAIGAAMLHWPLVSFGDLFAISKTGNLRISCQDIATGAAKRISLGSNTPVHLSPGNGLRKNKCSVLSG